MGAAVVCVAILATGFWFLFVPNWRPSLRDGERYGVDVSSHQGAIDWDAAADDGIEFAYIKASEGGDFVDRRFAANWSAARRAGLDVGAYHFFTLCRPGAEQARNFLSVAPPDASALPPAVDLETAGNCSRRPPRNEVRRELREFLAVVETAWKQDVIVYLRDDWESKYPGSDEGRPEWVFRFLRRPSEADWVVWQLHGFARVDGIDGRVDLDVMRLRPH